MTAPADKGKKAKTDADGGEENEQIDGVLVLSIEKLQEIQDELEKVSRKPLLPILRAVEHRCGCVCGNFPALNSNGSVVAIFVRALY
jgi:hypothetical protein